MAGRTPKNLKAGELHVGSILCIIFWWNGSNNTILDFYKRLAKVCFVEIRVIYRFSEVTKDLSRYHPAFLVKINEECDDIKPATLPEPPRKESNHKDVNNFLSVVKERDTVSMLLSRKNWFLRIPNSRKLWTNLPVSRLLPSAMPLCKALRAHPQ